MSLSALAISTGVSKAVSDAEWESRKQEALRRNRKRSAGSVILGSSLAGGMGAAINTGTRNRVVGGLGSAGVTGVAGGIAAVNRQRKLRRRIRDNDAALRASFERAKEQGLIKSDSGKKDKTKEATFGVANNVLSAAMGTYGAKAVYNQARDKQAAEGKMSPRKVKKPKTPKEPGRLMRVVRRAGSKVPAPVKRYAPHAAVAGAVGSQLFNVAGDVQAASYFARDLAANKKGKKVKDEHRADVGKAYRNFDSEDRRKHRLGLYQGVGLTAGGAATAAGVKRLKDTSNLSADRLRSIMARHKQTGALLATGAALTGAGAAAGRKAKKERDRSPWT